MCRDEAIEEALFAARFTHPKSDNRLNSLINSIYDQQAEFITQIKRMSNLLVPQKTLEDANDLIDSVFMIIADAVEDIELEKNTR
jgi:hypothetical protein